MIGSHALLRQAARTDWETPPELFERYERRFAFTLDVCASACNAKCASYFTPSIDGLKQNWGRNTCWMNPPYGRTIGAWVRKACEASQAGATVVCFLPARTDTGWWHDYVLHGEIEYLRGRVKFKRHDGRRSQAPFPSVIVVFRPSVAVQRCCA